MYRLNFILFLLLKRIWCLIDANIVPVFAKTVKVIKSGELGRAVTVKGIKVTPGAKSSIEAAGGKVEA